MKNKIQGALFLTSVMLGTTLPASALAASSENPVGSFAPININQSSSKYIVKFKDRVGKPTRLMARSQRLSQIAERVEFISKKGGKIRNKLERFNAIAAELTQSQLKMIQLDSSVDYVEEDPIRMPLALSVGEIEPWGLSAVEASGSLAANAPSGKTVCIIDSGYDLGHPDLMTSGVNGEGNSGTGAWDLPGSSHGTHVAGTIAGIADNGDGVIGVFPNQQVGLYIVKVFDNSGSWPTASDLIDAAEACADNGADVINMSLGGSGSSTSERNAFSQLLTDGVLSIAASGNDGTSDHSYPASYPDVVSVGAVDSNNDHAYFSQYTSQVELAGPGVAVRSSVIRGDGREADLTIAGTSYADYELVPHNRYIVSGSSYVSSPVNGSVIAPLFACSGSNCSGASGAICVIERSTNETNGNYPEFDDVSACANAGGVGAIVYSNSSLPGLQSPYLIDQDDETQILTLSVNRTTGLMLAGMSGQTATLELEDGANYAYYNGTSMATPHVAAVSALVWSYHASCSAEEIRSALTATALDLNSSGRDNYTGYGLVQSQAAVDYLNENGCSGSGSGGGSGEATTITEENLSASRREWLYYTVDVPSGMSNLTVTITGGTGDADLYVDADSQPSLWRYDCRPYESGNEETCSFDSPSAGSWYIGIRAYSAFRGLSLTVSYE